MQKIIFSIILITGLLNLNPDQTLAQAPLVPRGLEQAPIAAGSLTPPISSNETLKATATRSSILKPTALSGNAAFAFTLNDQEIAVSKSVLDSWKGVTVIAKTSQIELTPETIDNDLGVFFGQAAPLGPEKQETFIYALDKIYQFLAQQAESLDAPVAEPKLTIENGRAVAFSAPQDGEKLDVYQSARGTLSALQKNETSSELTVYVTKPQTQLSQLNDLGIKELIGHGVSSFKGSPKNRRHNIAVGVAKETGTIVAPGKEFSFNDNLGPVEAAEGFLPELVIKGDLGTIPEFGGGLCQVSTTTFRAAMDAGLPITARRNHSYAVQYYSPQGTDATIYPGSADLKFINDTPGSILIEPYLADANTLVFDIYGTKDGRKVTLEKPVVFDRQSNGAMKATWTRIVTAPDGQQRTDVFKSTYQPPALFHKTESFVSQTGSTTPSSIGPPAKTIAN